MIGVLSLRDRCVVTMIDPDSGAQDADVLRRINARFGGRVALNCWVIRPGLVQIDDPVRIVPAPSGPDRIGGWIVGAPYLHRPR